MVLLLSNDDAERVLNTADVLRVLDQAYLDQDQGLAANRPRTFTTGPSNGGRFLANTHEGILARDGVYNIRIVTSTRNMPSLQGQATIDQPVGIHIGLHLLYSTATGELLAIVHDGHLQRMRVQATNAIAARHMARQDTHTMALLGSGWQAGVSIEAMRSVRPIRTIKVYSRSPERRRKFARDMQRVHEEMAVIAVDTPQEAVKGADLVVAATNSRVPVCQGEWLEPGMHVTGVLASEFDVEAYRRADYIAIFNRLHGRDYTLSRGPEEQTLPETPWAQFLEGAPEIIDLVSGKAPGRTDDRQITMFANGGHGWGRDGGPGYPIQFTAVVKLLYDLAKERGLGRALPLEWFRQDVYS